MKFFFTLALLLCSTIVFSQEFEITGTVLDDQAQPLESATVYIEKPGDSSLVNYSISGRDGRFAIQGKTKEPKVNLFISYAGFEPYRQSLELKKEIKLGTIQLKIADNLLEEVVVTAARAPITIKKDTLEFNAGSFNTRPDANLEDLMKKLPGVEVDSDGKITINGKPISRILVNGEEFFGKDPKIATKNLPKEIIDKIQVTSTKTKSEEFTGKPGDPDNKTVNITVKKDKNKGYFARATAGGGTDERYELSGIGNYFKDDMRVSILGSSNNINSSGFSYDEVFGMMGRSVGRNAMGGGGSGITKAETAGFNFVDKWQDNLKLNADYFFGRNNTERKTTISRENILPDSRYFTNSEQKNNLLNDSHRANARFEVEFDTLTRLSINPSFNSNTSNSIRSRKEESLDGNQELINTSESQEQEDMQRNQFSNTLNLIRKFGNRGSYLQVRFTQQHQKQENDNFYYSESEFFKDDDPGVEIQDQYIDENEKQNHYTVQASKRTPLAKDFFLDVSYDFKHNNTKNQRWVYELSEENTSQTLNEDLSSDFEVRSNQHIPAAGLNYEGDVWRVDTNFGLLSTNLENQNFLEPGDFSKTYNNLFVKAQVRYELERSKSLSIGYNTNADIPSIQQLQPVINKTNPLHIVVGNPELKPAYRQAINMSFRNFNFSTHSGIFTWANLSFTDNRVAALTTVSEDLVRTTRYTNVNGSMNANLGAFYGKQVKNDATEFRYRFGANASYSKNVGFTNAVKFTSEQYTVSPNVDFTYVLTEKLEINPKYQLSFNSSKYDINSARNEDFIDHRVGLVLTSYWPKNVIFGNDISYNYFGNVGPEFDNTSLLWNMSLGYQFWNKDATLKVKVYDLLDQNIDTRRIIGDDYIQDTHSLILKRYAMLSFTYKLSNFGGQAPGGNRRHHRM